MNNKIKELEVATDNAYKNFHATVAPYIDAEAAWESNKETWGAYNIAKNIYSAAWEVYEANWNAYIAAQEAKEVEEAIAN